MPADLELHTRGLLRDAIRKNLAAIDAAERAGLPGRKDSLVMRAGLRAMAREARKEMRKRVRVRTGRTRRKIIAKTRTRNGTTVGIVSVPAPWNVLEFGRSPKGTKRQPTPKRNRRPGYVSPYERRGKYTRNYGGAPAYPFIVPSMLASEIKQLQAAGEAIQQALSKIKITI